MLGTNILLCVISQLSLPTHKPSARGLGLQLLTGPLPPFGRALPCRGRVELGGGREQKWKHSCFLAQVLESLGIENIGEM